MLTQRELGQGLKSVREIIGLTQQQVAAHVALTRDATELFREYGNLKKLLDIDQERNLPPVYTYGDPKNVWEAIQMGEQAAEAERGRLELGINPIRDRAGLVESQGIPIIGISLEDQISGYFYSQCESSQAPSCGYCIVRQKSPTPERIIE